TEAAPAGFRAHLGSAAGLHREWHPATHEKGPRRGPKHVARGQSEAAAPGQRDETFPSPRRGRQQIRQGVGLLPPLPGLENKNETPDPGSPLLRRSDPGLHAFASPRLCFCNNQVNAVVLEQEGRELETLARDLEGLPPLALDAARHRLSLRSGEGVLFYSASKGSIVLCGVVAGLSAWILQQTLGETLKEAWVESDMHKKLKRLLL